MKIAPQPGEWSSYWDKLATQVAGNTAPDIIQMDMAYIAEYGNRQALLDLSGVDTSKFIEGTVDSGKINDTLYGINAGINCLVVLANPKVFEKAGMDVPDDKTWTWDSMIDTAAEVASKAKVTFGFQSLVSANLFQAWIRQQGKQLFTPDALGFDTADVEGWFDYLVKAQKAGAIGSPSQINEEFAKSLDQSGDRGRHGRVGVVQLQPARGHHRGGGHGDLDAPLPDDHRQRGRAQGLVQGVDAVVGLGQDQEPRRGGRLHQLAGEHPGGGRHQPGRAGHAGQRRDPGGNHSRSSPRSSRRCRSSSPTSSPSWPTPRSPRRPVAARPDEIMQRFGTEVLFGRQSSAEAAQRLSSTR